MARLWYLAVFFIFLLGCKSADKSTDVMRKEIHQIISTKKATVGVSIIGNNGKDTISFNGNRQCPLQSVFKFHIALAVLSEIDKGKFTLDQNVEVKKEELLPDMYSPLREEHPDGGSFSIARLIQYAVSQSDNVACDILIKMIGTAKTVEEFIKKHNIQDIAINVNEEVMQAKWENMFLNWTTPKAASEVLRLFYENKGKQLSKSSYDFLWQAMKETSTGADRLKGSLPQNTVVAHKTGTSGTNAEGLTPATNDIGIVSLPNGDYFIISVLVTDSLENEATNAKIIADIAKVTYDYYYDKK
ncbi:MAG: class A beta-lactamase, subclass A2 [Saprospiraceae bacterium]|nr:class A beta-lactamase, subclass A2 [Saprospiraceae bacterium]